MKLIVAKRLVLFALIWLVLTRADVSGFAFGIVVAAGSTWVSLILLPPGSHRVSIAGMIRLAPGFLRSSLLGGIDVARRALHPRMPLDAGWIAYRTKLPRGLPRVINVINRVQQGIDAMRFGRGADNDSQSPGL